jgi:uncharacterized protein YcbX
VTADLRVGTIAQLQTFPVKGMAGVATSRAHLGFHGLPFDRQFAFQRLDDAGGLPFVGGRECPDLQCFVASTVGERVIVTTVEGDEFDIRSPALLNRIEYLVGERLHLVQIWARTFDSATVSLITEQSVARIAQLAKTDSHSLRYRSNVLVTASSSGDYPEDRWIGRTLKAPSGAMLTIIRQTQRCQVVDVGQHRPVWPLVREERRNKLGVYAAVIRAGELDVGDLLVFRS